MSNNMFFNNDSNDNEFDNTNYNNEDFNNNESIDNSFMNNQFIKQENIEEEPSFNFNNNNKAKNKSNIKSLLPIIIVIIILMILVILLLKGFGSEVETFSNHTNNTGSKDYIDNDVSYNCTYTNSNENRTLTENSDILYDFKKGNEIYQVRIYNKIDVKYNEELTDEAFRTIIDELDNTICGLNEEECQKNHIELEMTDLGWNTVIDRKENNIIITFNNFYGLNKKATKEVKEKAKNDLVSEGYICN